MVRLAMPRRTALVVRPSRIGSAGGSRPRSHVCMRTPYRASDARNDEREGLQTLPNGGLFSHFAPGSLRFASRTQAFSAACFAPASRPSQQLYTEAHAARCLGMPVKRLLDNPPTLRHAEECEEIRHSDTGTCQLARPVRDLKPYHSDRLGDVHADDP